MTNDKYSEKDALYKNRTINPGEEIGIKIKGYEKRTIKLEYSYICQWSRYNLENTKIKYFTGSGKEKEKEYNENPFEYMIWEVSK